MDQPRRIIIVGGGVRGLACAINLGQKSDLNIIIIDVRAELGMPIQRPGIFRDLQSLKNRFLELKIIDNQTTPIMIGNGALRREWLVKAMAIKATEIGSTISCRTRFLGAQIEDDICIMTKGAGPLKESEQCCDLLVIATGIDPDPVEGVVPTTISLPEDERIIRSQQTSSLQQSANHIEWYGAIYSRGSVVGENVGLRSDGTLESWQTKESDFQDNALERMMCLSNQKLPTIEESLAIGQQLSDAVLNRLKESATP